MLGIEAALADEGVVGDPHQGVEQLLAAGERHLRHIVDDGLAVANQYPGEQNLMQVQADVNHIRGRRRTDHRGQRRIDHAGGLERALAGDAEQQPELLLGEMPRNREDDLAVDFRLVREGEQMAVGQVGVMADAAADRQRRQVQLVPELVVAVGGEEPVPGLGLGAEQQFLALEQGETRAAGEDAAGVHGSQGRVVDFNDGQAHVRPSSGSGTCRRLIRRSSQ